MLKKSNLPFLIVAVLLLNGLIYLRATFTLEEFEVIFGECARNSGRTSAALNLLILVMIGFYGLTAIYKNENKKDSLWVLITLFAINHLIHFFFVYTYFTNHISDIGISHHPHGFITFVCILALPIILWRTKHMSKLLYFAVILHLINVTYFISDTFYNRVKPEDSAYLHQVGVLVMIGAVIYVIYSVFKEKLGHKKSI